jgi:pyruvate,water dikinase
VFHDKQSADLKSLQPQVARAQEFVALREAAKHHLILGYGVLRRILLELDLRHRLGGGTFYLTPGELPQLVAGEAMDERIRQRRQQRALALSLEVPTVLFSDDLEAIGRPLPVTGADELQGTPVSAGVVEGVALVCEDPSAEVPLEDGFILVCPSTDPAWVPLFLRARGLVMETGGILSHGAIVAREFHLPAVAGIANALRIIRTGQKLRVDGNTGRVHVF